MQAIDFILEILGHFARREDGPPPLVPATPEGDFERDLVWLCEWHGITPIVLSSLERLALRPQLSRVTLERMKALNRAARSLTEDMLSTTHELAAACAQRDVDMRVLGDVALAGTVYRDEGLRPIDHIELLVAEMRWTEVLEACREVDFRTDEPLPLFNSGIEALHYFQHFPPCVLDNQKGDRLHLRLRLFEMGEPEVAERAWEGKRNLTGRLDGVAGVAVEDQVIHSALAYNISGFGKLVHSVDLAMMLTADEPGIDWDYIEERLLERSLYPAFCFTLENVVRWLKLPGDFVLLRRPGRVRRKLFDVTWPAGRISFSIKQAEQQHRLKFYLVESGSWGEKFTLLKRMLSPRREWVTAFYRRPYRPWLKLKFIMRVLRSRAGMRPTA